jgi:hypothetical protein
MMNMVYTELYKKSYNPEPVESTFTKTTYYKVLAAWKDYISLIRA